jgi:hypothetical protein
MTEVVHEHHAKRFVREADPVGTPLGKISGADTDASERGAIRPIGALTSGSRGRARLDRPATM